MHSQANQVYVLPSLLSICARANIPKTNVYFGFAPTITKSYYSDKTPTIMKAIGIDQLLLETDLEDSTNALDDLMTGVDGWRQHWIWTVEDVATVTYQNAMRFYFDKSTYLYRYKPIGYNFSMVNNQQYHLS
jgi:hypothetical protein